MPIYSNLYSNLARQGLAKTLTQGYAQSVVAVTHPSTYQSQQHRHSFNNRPHRFSKLSVHSQSAFHTSSAAAASASQDVRPDKHYLHGGLDAYFEAWKNQHPVGEPEKEWTQFQFAKRIEWQPALPLEEVTAAAQCDVDVDVEPARAKSPLNRSFSSNALDDLRRRQDDEDAKGDGLQIHLQDDLREQIKAAHERALLETDLSAHSSRVHTPPLVAREEDAAAAQAFGQSQTYAEHLAKLSNAGRYAEIPAVFEAMLVAGIQPTAAAYNALIDAAINIPTEPTQRIPKTLEVYSDLLRRKVSPDATTYDRIINLIASRSREISAQKQVLEEKRLRFGGMDEAGKFMFASHRLEYDILVEDDRLDLAVKFFHDAVAAGKDMSFPAETYRQLIAACADASLVADMTRIYQHMATKSVVPVGAIFPIMMHAFAAAGDLRSAVQRYNEYKAMAIAHDDGLLAISDRQDAAIYAAVVKAYITSDKMEGATKFYNKVTTSFGKQSDVTNAMIAQGFVQGLLERGRMPEALTWAESLDANSKPSPMAKIATMAADRGDVATATAAFAQIPVDYEALARPAVAMLALSVRVGDVARANKFWRIIAAPNMLPSASFIEPTAMYAVALIGTGRVVEGMGEALHMFERIKAASSADQLPLVIDQIDEGAAFISRFMSSRGISVQQPTVLDSPPFDPAHFASGYHAPPTPPGPYAAPAPAFEDTFDPYAASTDFKGSSLIAEELERGSNSRYKGSRLNEALGRFRNIRRAGRHPRYITYAKLIAAAAREEKMDLVHDILGMARSDVPLLMQYPVVRYGWVSILDAMIGACLTIGNRHLAAKYHQELLDMGATPTANTYGLYITTLKESTKTFDEASEAVKIFHRAKSEGVEPSSFLYNALIGKLGKARRIDDCLFYFGEMRALGIRPTSVTYGTIVNALCRVSDEKFAEELFEEMESMPNYKPRPAPYNSLMQFFLTTKRDKSKVLAYYERMKSKGIEPTNHTYKLLVDTHATLEPVNMAAAEAVLDVIRSTGQRPEGVHYASLIHAKGCVQHDMDGARKVFDAVMADPSIPAQACLYQALFESMVANHRVADTEPLLRDMRARRVDMTPYIANTLIHGWANEKQIEKSKGIFAAVGREKREPSTYEAMTRAFLTVEDRASAQAVVQEMCSRGYPSAVTNKVVELVGGGSGATL